MVSLEAFVIGFGLGFALAAPPGPVLAQLAVETAAGRPWKGLRVGFGALTADMTFFVLTFIGVLKVVPGAHVLGVLAVAGGGLMLYFARGAWRAARSPVAMPPGKLTGFPGGYLLAATSPFNFAFWLTTGATFVAAHGPGIAGGFFLAIALVIVAYVLLVLFGSRRIERFETYVSYASALFLAGFAVYLGVHAGTMLGAW